MFMVVVIVLTNVNMVPCELMRFAYEVYHLNVHVARRDCFVLE